MTALTVTRDGDVLHIDLIPGADGPDTEGEEVTPGVVLLYDGHGWLIGIEIDTAILRDRRWSMKQQEKEIQNNDTRNSHQRRTEA